MASTKALAKNEELFRNINERIEEVSAAVPWQEPLLGFLCECDRTGCEETFPATRAEYEEVREEPTHFIVIPGHEDPRVEQVISSTDRFVVVKKRGQAATDAKSTDPRKAN